MAQNKALMLINLGSPASYSEEDVRNYLRQFFADPYVIDYPKWLRSFISQMILRKRPKLTAANYAKIWLPEGSPLVVYSQQLADAVAAKWGGKVVLAMRYGQPSIEAVLQQLAAQNIDEVLLLPLYPHFTQSTIMSAVAETKRINANFFANRFKFTQVAPFFQHPAYIASLAASIAPYLEQDFDHFLFSFHGVPERHIRKLTNAINPQHNLQSLDVSDLDENLLQACYRSQCLHTAELAAQKLNLSQDKWSVAFQSRLGGGRWITPYLAQHLDDLAAQNKRQILVVSPSFVVDCIETLEELKIRYANNFKQKTGGTLQIIPCLNTADMWIEALIKIAKNY